MNKPQITCVPLRCAYQNPTLYLVMFGWIICMMASSCTSLRPVTDTPDKVLPHVVAQSRVQILLKNGERIDKLKVSSIDSATIIGRQDKATLTILVDSIQFIEKTFDEDGKRRRMNILKPGDIIQVTYPDGHKLKKLKVVSLEAEAITVTVRDPKTRIDKTMVLVRSDIQTIKMRVPDATKTISLVAIPVVALTIILILPDGPSFKLNLFGK